MNIVFWDSHTKTWKARMEFSQEELLDIAIEYAGESEFSRLADEIHRHNRERDDFND